MQTLLIGMGNPILTDDAIGVRLAKDFKSRINHAEGIPGLVIFEECSLGGLNLLDAVIGYDRLIVLDSIKTQGGTPGTWYYFTAKSLRSTMNICNIHDANFATAMELGRRLGKKIPLDENIHVFAVEIKDNITFAETMSPALEASYPVIFEEISKEILYIFKMFENIGAGT